MTINKKLGKAVALPAALLALATTPANGVVVDDTGIGNIAGTVTAGVNYTNDDLGASYTSLTTDSQWFDLWSQAYGVSDAYTAPELASSGLIGYNISNGSEVGDGWYTTQNADGTIDFDNIGGPSDSFSNPSTLSGNFFADSQLNDMDGDGNANYTLKFLEDLTADELNNSLTITGSLGANNDGYSVIANAGATSFNSLNDNQVYALVATANHPAIPEPSSLALLAGLGAGALALYKRRKE